MPPDLTSLARRALRTAANRFTDRLRGQPATPTGPVTVEFAGLSTGEVPGGVTLLEAARLLGVDLNHYCGGTCSCGTCRVVVVDGLRLLSRAEGREEMVLGASSTARGDRLACQARVLGPVKVRVPDRF